ncbi:MAG: L,D-transpeptidase [Mesorhizobium sp.]|nr:L,D-transpeptidase [Mesorhizobium sp.]
MLRILLLAGAATAAVVAAQPAAAQSRYAEPPPLMVSPDLTAPWVMQLKRSPNGRRVAAPAIRRNVSMSQPQLRQLRRVERQTADPTIRTAAVRVPQPQEQKYRIDPKYLPQEVDYSGPHGPGTIVIDTTDNFLYLVQNGGTARRYGVGTGKPGFEWAGTHKVTQKKEWPDWRPPAEMIVRERAKGRILPVHMAGGPENPLGARALYLGSTLYRIHGTNQPWTIGGAVSSGCIRMRNEDVIDLYERVKVGTKVVVM